MTVILVEPDPQLKTGPCSKCGGTSFMLVGFLYVDGQPRGAYYVDWCEGEHFERCATITMSLGPGWEDDDSEGEGKVAFSIDYRCEGMTLMDEPLRDRPGLLGRFVGREEALASEPEHLWHFVDHIVDDDSRVSSVSDWLCGHRPTVLGTASQ